jgi:hypothetical protein
MLMFWMRTYLLRGQVGGGWALDFNSFLGPVKWHRADRRVPFGAQKTYVQEPTREVSGPILGGGGGSTCINELNRPARATYVHKGN